MTKPVYDKDGITIYHSRWQDVIGQLPKDYADHTFTDPPYDEATHARARTGEGTEGDGTGEILIDFDPVTDQNVREAFQVCGHVAKRWLVSFADYRHVPLLYTSPPPGLRFVRFGLWCKPNGNPQKSGDRPAQGWEALPILHRSLEAGGGRMRWNGGGRSAVYTFPKVNHPKHKTKKPVALARRLLLDFTDPGDLILDPFGGVGTFARAALDTGRRAIVCEMSGEYCEWAIRSIQQLTLPGMPNGDPFETEESAEVD